MTVVQKDGTTADVVLTNCKYVPQLFTNLFSITKALQKGWNISNHGDSGMKITKDQLMIIFDHDIKTEQEQILAVEMVLRHESANQLLDQRKIVDINFRHTVLGHANEETTKRTAKYYNVKLTDTMTKCEHCALAKARQKNVAKC